MTLNTGSPTYCRTTDNYCSHIDLSITNIDIVHDFHWETCEYLFESDHFPIIIKYKCEKLYNKKQKSWILKKANWKIYRDNIKIEDCSDINDTELMKNLGRSVSKAIIDAAMLLFHSQKVKLK